MAVFANRRLWIAVLAALALAFPLLVTNSYYLHMMTISFIWMIAVYGLNLFAGYTGYLSLAHAGFFAIGAYALGILTVKAGVPFWLAFVLACLFTTLLGVVIGLVALRTKEHFFAIYTLCVGYIIYLIIDKWDSLTGGVRGFIGIPAPADIGPLSFQTPVAQYYLVLCFLVAVIFTMYRLVYSLTGRTYIAIRNSEELALTLEGSIGVMPLVESDQPAVPEFVKNYRAKFNEDPGSEAAYNYLALYAFVEAMKAVGTVDDPQAIREHMNDSLKNIPAEKKVYNVQASATMADLNRKSSWLRWKMEKLCRLS
ncbi:Branched-chain amino acid ABC transporterpermease protein [Geobacillus stearothermophilus]|nr:Branched-chain amino acid ABC transporterpermease protein [Geobacillus stearothermophilus]